MPTKPTKEEIIQAFKDGKITNKDTLGNFLSNYDVISTIKEIVAKEANKGLQIGVAVFTNETIQKDSSAHLRFFAPYHGIDEDPVTGSACGPLLLILIKLGLIKDYRDDSLVIIEQGDVLNRKGRVEVKFNSYKNELIIAGNAITVIKGKLNF